MNNSSSKNQIQNDASKISSAIKKCSQELKKANVDSSLCLRLNEFANDLQNNTAQWIKSDIFKLYNPYSFRQSVQNTLLRSFLKLKTTLELVSKSISLLIILLSFTATTKAFSIYASTPNTGSTFLQLWSQGFSGNLPGIFTLDKLIIIDGALLSILLIITAVVSHQEKTLKQKSAAQADLWIEKLDNLLWQAQQIINEKQRYDLSNTEQRSYVIIQSLGQFVEQFKQNTDLLENTIQSESQRISQLGSQREAEMQQLQEITTNLKESSSHFVESSTHLSQILENFDLAATTFAGEIGRLANFQESLLNTSREMEDQLEKFQQVVTRLGQLQKKTSSDLLEATTQNLEKSNELTATITDLSKISRQITEGHINLQNSLDDQMRSNDGWIKSLQSSMKTISEALESMNQLEQKIDQFSATISNSQKKPSS